jgi:hypothetical protein
VNFVEDLINAGQHLAIKTTCLGDNNVLARFQLSHEFSTVQEGIDSGFDLMGHIGVLLATRQTSNAKTRVHAFRLNDANFRNGAGTPHFRCDHECCVKTFSVQRIPWSLLLFAKRTTKHKLHMDRLFKMFEGQTLGDICI